MSLPSSYFSVIRACPRLEFDVISWTESRPSRSRSTGSVIAASTSSAEAPVHFTVMVMDAMSKVGKNCALSREGPRSDEQHDRHQQIARDRVTREPRDEPAGRPGAGDAVSGDVVIDAARLRFGRDSCWPVPDPGEGLPDGAEVGPFPPPSAFRPACRRSAASRTPTGRGRGIGASCRASRMRSRIPVLRIARRREVYRRSWCPLASFAFTSTQDIARFSRLFGMRQPDDASVPWKSTGTATD